MPAGRDSAEGLCVSGHVVAPRHDGAVTLDVRSGVLAARGRVGSSAECSRAEPCLWRWCSSARDVGLPLLDRVSFAASGTGSAEDAFFVEFGILKERPVLLDVGGHQQQRDEDGLWGDAADAATVG